MFNEFVIVEMMLILSITYFLNTSNLVSAWYLAGIYLFVLGLLLLLQDGDIFVGFLWVIDLGVGLIFLLFILHFSSFLKHKTWDMISSKLLSWKMFGLMILSVYFYYEAFPISRSYQAGAGITSIVWFDYYDLFTAVIISDLNLMREVYFFNNSFEFVIINFMLLYGIITAVLLTFLIQKTFNFLSNAMSSNVPLETSLSAGFFIRTQNLSLQQQMSTGTRVWIKKRNDKI